MPPEMQRKISFAHCRWAKQILFNFHRKPAAQSRGYKGPGMFLCRGARLREAMEIPVLDDDRHRTAIISVAALPNALELQGKTIEPVKVVFSGAGAGRYASNPTRRTRHTNSTPPNRKRRFIFLDPLACPPLRN
jgi:hypothetical protein